MPEFSATFTIAQIKATTREKILKRFIEETGLGEVGTATGGDTASISDTTVLRSTQYDRRDHVGGWARISNNSGSAPEGEIKAVTQYEPDDLGKITVSPTFSVAVASGMHYELWHNPHPQRVIDFLDKLLTEELFFPCWTILTECPDGDMEQNNTTDWSGVNATLTKTTGLSGKYSLLVAPTLANGYGKNATSFRCEPQQEYHVSAIGQIVTGTNIRLEIWDDTNGASITYIENSTLYPNRIWSNFYTPSGCYSFSIRMGGGAGGGNTKWDEVCIYPVGATTIRLPWWIKSRAQRLAIFQLRPQITGQATPTTGSGGLWDSTLQGEIDRRWSIQDIFYGDGGLKIESHVGGISKPLYIVGLRNEVAYSNDTVDTKYVDETLIVNALKFKVYDYLIGRNLTGQMGTKSVTERMGTAYKIWKAQEAALKESIEKILADAPHIDVPVYDKWTRYRYGH